MDPKRAATLLATATIALLLTAIALTGCEKPPPTPVTLRIAVFQSIDFLPYYVIQDQGFDKKNGLRFEATQVAGGAAVIDAIAAGTVDMGSHAGITPVLVAVERGLIPEKVVAVAANAFADRDHRGVGVIAAHTVRSWKDLEGKQIGVVDRNSVNAAVMDARLKQEGVRGYSYVHLLMSNQGLAVAGGNVAAAAMIEPYVTQSLLRGDGKLLDWIVGGPPLERMQFGSIVFSAEFHRRNPEGVKAFLRANLAAVRWINEHPDEARLVLVRRLNLSAEVASKVNLFHWPMDARSDPALNDRTQQLLLETGTLKRPVDISRLHDETLLAEVLKEKR